MHRSLCSILLAMDTYVVPNSLSQETLLKKHPCHVTGFTCVRFQEWSYYYFLMHDLYYFFKKIFIFFDIQYYFVLVSGMQHSG